MKLYEQLKYLFAVALLTSMVACGGAGAPEVDRDPEPEPLPDKGPTPLTLVVDGAEEAFYAQELTFTAQVTGEGAAAATVQWSASAGVLSSTEGLSTTWTAPAVSGEVEITASLDGEELSGSVTVQVQLCTAGDFEDENEPCAITNLWQLQAVSEQPGGHFRLVADIDASPTAGWNDGAGFAPIAMDVPKGFTGTFDGGGHTVSDLTIARGDAEDIGLFAFVGQDGAVENLELTDVSIVGERMVGAVAGRSYGSIVDVHVTGEVSGVSYVGGLVGNNGGEVAHASGRATVHGTVSTIGGLVGGNTSKNGLIRNSHADSPLVETTGTGASAGTIGGLVGGNWGTVVDSYSSSKVVSSASVAGGLVGNNLANQGAGIVLRSFTTVAASVEGDYSVGGLVGSSYGQIIDSYSLASTVRGASDVGGLLGFNRAVPDPNSNAGQGVVTRTYSMSSVEGASNLGGLVGNASAEATVHSSYWDVQRSGQDTSAGGEGRATPQMLFKSNYEGWDFTVTWSIEEGNGTPDLLFNPRPELN